MLILQQFVPLNAWYLPSFSINIIGMPATSPRKSKASVVKILTYIVLFYAAKFSLFQKSVKRGFRKTSNFSDAITILCWILSSPYKKFGFFISWHIIFGYLANFVICLVLRSQTFVQLTVNFIQFTTSHEKNSWNLHVCHPYLTSTKADLIAHFALPTIIEFCGDENNYCAVRFFHICFNITS